MTFVSFDDALNNIQKLQADQDELGRFLRTNENILDRIYQDDIRQYSPVFRNLITDGFWIDSKFFKISSYEKRT